jgi:hypothetical protein
MNMPHRQRVQFKGITVIVAIVVGLAVSVFGSSHLTITLAYADKKPVQYCFKFVSSDSSNNGNGNRGGYCAPTPELCESARQLYLADPNFEVISRCKPTVQN